MACGRLIDLRFNHHFQSINGKPNSIEVGSIVHKVKEIYYGEIIKGFSKSQARSSGLTAGLMYAQGCRHCAEFEPHSCSTCKGIEKSILDICPDCDGLGEIFKPRCGHQPNEYPGVFNTPVDNEKDPKRIGYKWALETCEQYFDYYKNDHWVPLEVEVVKKKLLYEDDEIRILWKAKLDLISDTNDGIFSIDHKTMQQNRSIISLNNQFTGQCLVMGTRKTFINKIGFQTSLPPEKKFIREPVCYSAARLLEWQSETLPYWAKTLLSYEESGHFPVNLTGCETKYGKCMMLKVCEADPDMREEVLRNNFVVGEAWDPK